MSNNNGIVTLWAFTMMLGERAFLVDVSCTNVYGTVIDTFHDKMDALTVLLIV